MGLSPALARDPLPATPVSDSLPLTIHPVTSLGEVAALAAGWTTLLSQSRSAGNVFLSWEWMYTWARHYLVDGQPWVLTVREGSRLVGILPLYRRRARPDGLLPVREARFLGSEEVCSSYLDLLAPARQHDAVLRRLLEYLHGEAAAEWDLLTLSELPAESSSIDLWTAWVEEAGKVVECLRPTVCPVIELPGGLDGFHATLSAHERYKLRRGQRRLAEAGRVQLERLTAPEELPRALESLAALHGLRWDARGSGGAFRRPRFLAFHREFVELAGRRGWARLDFLKLDGEAIAGVYGWSCAGRYSYYLPGLNPGVLPALSPGILLLSHCVEQAIREGCREVDLLQGRAAYKTAWATSFRRSLTLRLYNRRARPALLKLLLGARDAIKVALR
jgi:CelD/BcsL family acetyltransferase involved in cellulose biosynthesis